MCQVMSRLVCWKRDLFCDRSAIPGKTQRIDAAGAIELASHGALRLLVRLVEEISCVELARESRKQREPQRKIDNAAGRFIRHGKWTLARRDDSPTDMIEEQRCAQRRPR